MLPQTYQVPPPNPNPSPSPSPNPKTYQVPPVALPAPLERASPPRPSATLSVTARGPLLGCFVRTSRMHPHSVGQWLSTLQRTAGARLWALVEAPAARRALADEAAAAGVDRHRLGFVGFAPKALHLSRHAALALVLDTSPLYASHTTAADALRAAVPLLPLPGSSFASRVSAGALAAGGAPQLGASSRRAQLDLAAHLLLPAAPPPCPILG